MDELNITSAQYVAEDGRNIGITFVVDGETMAVSINSKHPYYAEIMRQVNAGTLTIQDAS